MDLDEPRRPSSGRDLIEFVSSLTDTARLRVEETLPHGFVRLKVAEAERRQARHDIQSVEDIVTELVRNSRDAGARNILVGFQKDRGRYRRITVIDDGRGIPVDMHQVVFEPRVTSKSRDFEEDRYGVHGRGMALFSIRSRVPDAGIVTSVPGRGTVISLTADTKEIPERADQATYPRIENGEEGIGVGGGPHNVPRIMLEMSVDSPDINFFLGSFAEVLATARKLPSEAEKVWSRVAEVTEARELAGSSALTMGLPVSERNAYRILKEEIGPLTPVRGQGYRAQETPGVGPSEVATVQRGIRTGNPLRRVRRDELDEIGEQAREVVDGVMARYFLKTYGTPKVRKGRGKVTISFYVAEEEDK